MKEDENRLNKLLDNIVPSDDGLKVGSSWDNLEMEGHMKMIARLTKVKYDALVREGFSKAEALELSKNLLGEIK